MFVSEPCVISYWTATSSAEWSRSDRFTVTRIDVFAGWQNDVVRTIQFDDYDDNIQPSKSDVTGRITEPQVVI